MLGGVNRHMLPHLPRVPHLHVKRPLVSKRAMCKTLLVKMGSLRKGRSTGSEAYPFFNMSWQHLFTIAKWIYPYINDLPKHLGKATAQEWKKSSWGRRATLKNVFALGYNSPASYLPSLWNRGLICNMKMAKFVDKTESGVIVIAGQGLVFW